MKTILVLCLSLPLMAQTVTKNAPDPSQLTFDTGHFPKPASTVHDIAVQQIEDWAAYEKSKPPLVIADGLFSFQPRTDVLLMTWEFTGKKPKSVFVDGHGKITLHGVSAMDALLAVVAMDVTDKMNQERAEEERRKKQSTPMKPESPCSLTCITLPTSHSGRAHLVPAAWQAPPKSNPPCRSIDGRWDYNGIDFKTQDECEKYRAHPEATTGDPMVSPHTPTFTDTQRALFFKAQSGAAQSAATAQAAAQQAQKEQAAFDAVIAQFRAICGKDLDLQLSQDNEPVCVVKGKK